jgi:GTP-binding protein
MPLAIAVVGRPNVGKSTLFNRLAGKQLAIVHDTPGVTRDRQDAVAQLGSMSVRLIDTAGFDIGAPGSLSMRMTDQTLAAIKEADVCLFVVNARDGVTTGDEIIADALRRSGKPVVLIANKCDVQLDLTEFYALGFGEPIGVSAVHNLGTDEIVDALEPFGVEEEPVPEEAEPVEAVDRPLKLAIVGRPNVGKSSLFNRMLGEERSLTGPEAGLTRDSIAATWEVDGRTIQLHDTAGLRKRARAAGEELEQLAVQSALTAIRFAECVIVVVDATAPFEKQDLTIVDMVAKEGRAIVFALNKWDQIEAPAGAITALKKHLDHLLPQIAGAPLVGISALTGEGVDRILLAVLEADAAWNTRVPTAQLNRFLAAALASHPTPAIHGRRVRIRYMTQAKSRPPTFALFGTQLDGLPDHYLRYLQNELRKAFNLQGVPLRFSLRTSTNPYADR